MPTNTTCWRQVLMDFVTVIGFDDLIYNLHNQGLAIVTTWILMLLLFVWPYEMMVGQLGSTFQNEGGGLSSWIRSTNGDLAGYSCLPVLDCRASLRSRRQFRSCLYQLASKRKRRSQ